MIKWIKDNSVCLIFFVFFLVVLFQNQFLWLFYDDYGYITLSYLPNYNGNMGINTSVYDIINFLIYHYQTWGGRILYFFLEIIILRIGLPFYRLIQSLITTGIFFLIYKILKKELNYDSWILALSSCACYGIFEIMTLRGGIFWPTASVLYWFPLLPFLSFVYIYKSNIKNIWLKVFCGILIFLSSFSQEQIATLALSYVGLMLIYELFRTKRINFNNILMSIISIVGFLLLALCPGSKSRLNTGSYFNQLSIIEKVKINLPNILFSIFGQYTKIFTLLFLLCAIYFSYKNLKNVKLKKYIKFNYLCLISTSLILLENGFYNGAAFNYFFYLKDEKLWHIFSAVVIAAQMLLILISAVVYFKFEKKEKFNYLIFAIINSQIVMLVAPYYPLRSSIMLDTICFLFILYVLFKIKNKAVLKYALILFYTIVICNFSMITYGYYSNNYAQKYNDATLRTASIEIKNGKNIDSIKLYKLKNDVYGIEEPYNSENNYISVLIKHYYNLPESIIFIYE